MGKRIRYSDYINCPHCDNDIELDLEDIVNDNEGDILDILENEIEERAEEIAIKWQKEDKKQAHVCFFDQIIELIAKIKYWPAPVDIRYELEEIIRQAKEKMQKE